MSKIKVDLAPTRSMSSVGRATTSMVTVKLKALGIKVPDKDGKKTKSKPKKSVEQSLAEKLKMGLEPTTEDAQLSNAFSIQLQKQKDRAERIRKAEELKAKESSHDNSDFDQDGTQFHVHYQAKTSRFAQTTVVTTEEEIPQQQQQQHHKKEDEYQKAEKKDIFQQMLDDIIKEENRKKKKQRPSACFMTAPRFSNSLGLDTGVFAVSTEKWDTPPVGYYNPKYKAVSKRVPVTKIKQPSSQSAEEGYGYYRSKSAFGYSTTSGSSTKPRASPRPSTTRGGKRSSPQSRFDYDEDDDENDAEVAEVQKMSAEEKAALEAERLKEAKKNESFFFKTTPRNYHNKFTQNGADTFYYPNDEKLKKRVPSVDLSKMTSRDDGPQPYHSGPQFYDTKKAVDATRKRSEGSRLIPSFDKQLARDKKPISIFVGDPTCLEYDVTDEAYSRLSKARRTPDFVGDFSKQISREDRQKQSAFGRQEKVPLVPKTPYQIEKADGIVSKRDPVVKFSKPPPKEMFYRPKTAKSRRAKQANKENDGVDFVDYTGVFVDANGRVHAKQDTYRAPSARPTSAPDFKRMTGHVDMHKNLKVKGVDLMYDPKPVEKHTPSVIIEKQNPRFRKVGIRGEPIIDPYSDTQRHNYNRPATKFDKRGQSASRQRYKSNAKRRPATANTKRVYGVGLDAETISSRLQRATSAVNKGDSPFDKQISREQRIRAQEDKPVRSSTLQYSGENPNLKKRSWTPEFSKSLSRDSRSVGHPLKVLSPRQDTFKVLH